MITIWHRIELDTVDEARNEALDRTIPAPVHDPLWLLARQRQMGEWQGSDGGSIVEARITTRVDPIVALSAHGVSEDVRGRPLEPIVEAERNRPDVRTRVRAGLQLVISLTDAGLEYREALVLAFPPPPTTGDDAIYAALAAAPDGLLAFLAIRDGTAAATVGVSSDELELFDRVSKSFADWFALQAGAGIDTWDRERLEHRFEIQSEARTFAAPSYGGGRLDWDAFDLTAERTATSSDEEAQTVLPLPIEVPGMPVARYWELEDPTTEPGAIEIGPGEAARALLLEFSLRLGTDWSIAPFATRAGAVTHVRSLIVLDTFGTPTEMRSATTVRTDPSWRLWSSTGSDGDSAVLLLPFAIDAVEGPILEEVAFTRDEQANLIWAIERVVPGSLGRGEVVREPAPLPEEASATPLVYRPLPHLPIAHVPFLKRVVDKVTWLVRARAPEGVSAWEPRGHVVPSSPRVRDVDVPPEGVVIVRKTQLTRDATGATIVWSGRARAPGIESPAVRIAYDDLQIRN